MNSVINRHFFFLFFPADICVQVGIAIALAAARQRRETVQMPSVQQNIRKQLVPEPAHAHPSGHQTVPVRHLPAEVHAAQPPAAAHTHAHRRQAVQVQAPGLHQSVLAAQQPAVALPVPPDGQTVQVQLVLQVLPGRAVAARAHTQAQGVQTPQDAHMPVLRQVVHAGDVPVQAHAKARRADGQAAADHRHTSRGPGERRVLGQDVAGHGQQPGGSHQPATATARVHARRRRRRRRFQRRWRSRDCR